MSSKTGLLLRSERRMPAIVALTLLPWFAVALFTAGSLVALHFVGYVVLVSVAGYGVIGAILPSHARLRIITLAPAIGIMAISALTVFWLRLGLQLPWASALWLGLAAIGALVLWRDRGLVARHTVEYGLALAILSTLVCLLYFLPGALRDGVRKSDGSFNWMYVDTQYLHSIAAGIKTSDGPPKMSGTATKEIYYHIGGYAPAGAISRFTGLDLGDAFVRVTRNASLWALVLSCFGLGTLLSVKATGKSFGGIMSVAGLFFYGSLLSLFSEEENTASSVTGAILFKIPGVQVLADGGPFSHFILGHSVLHGMIAITSIMGLCLACREAEIHRNWRVLFCVALPVLAVPMDSPASLYCFGVAGVIIFWGYLSELRWWWLILFQAVLYFGAWRLMGYNHAPMAATSSFTGNFIPLWWSLAVWFIAGLGIRIVGLRWLEWPLRDPCSVMVLISMAGLLSFYLFFRLYGGNERYGIYFLQCMLSIFAFSRLQPGFWHGTDRSKLIADWLRLAQRGLLLFAVSGVAIAVFCHVTHGQTGIPAFIPKVFLSLVLLALLAGGSILMRRSRGFAPVGSAILLSFLLFGFLAWISPWVNFGLGRMKLDVTLTPGEVQGLECLRKISIPDERFATNKHAVNGLINRPERSYAYVTLSERPVLLEGWWLGGERFLPEYQTLLDDNELLFTTTNPNTLRTIAEKYRVVFLVARPGTDIALSKPLPNWLEEESNCGDLKIYRIN
jgi:hypothetical protein